MLFAMSDVFWSGFWAAMLGLIGIAGTLAKGWWDRRQVQKNLTAVEDKVSAGIRKGEVAAQKADEAVETVKESTQLLSDKIDENTQVTKGTHGIVNGERSAMLQQLSDRTKELADTRDELKNAIARIAALELATRKEAP